MTLSSEVYPIPDVTGEKYRSCRLCGAFVTRVELRFEGTLVEPTVGETLTGQDSGATGIVENVELVSGSYAAGTAAGYIMLTSPTGIDNDTGTSFVDGEDIDGTVSGVGFTYAVGPGLRKSYGRLYPESALVEADGGYYCRFHYDFKYGPRNRDEATIDITEEND